MIAQVESLGKAEATFSVMMEFVKQAIKSNELRIDEVERALFDQLLVVGRHALQGLIDAAGDGNHGETVEHDGKTLQRSEDRKTKPYRSIFGVLSVERYVYASGPKKKVEWAPVDARLSLPAGEQSYVLEDWMLRVCVKESFEEGVGSLRDLLGVNTSVRAAEIMTRNMAEHADSFSETKAAPKCGHRRRNHRARCRRQGCTDAASPGRATQGASSRCDARGISSSGLSVSPRRVRLTQEKAPWARRKTHAQADGLCRRRV